jgi:3',5'-cyclic-AMP phosphodiesterase
LLIGHLTDLHMVEEGALLGRVLDVNMLVRTAVETINSAPVPPAFVVVTGDLTHNGTEQQTALARDTLDHLDMPYFALPGGHDDAAIFARTFADRGWLDPASGDIRYVMDDHAVQLVVADTTAKEGHMPTFGPERCDWLDQRLSDAADKPTLLAIHHPPFQCRIPARAYCDDFGMSWAQGLKEVVSGHSHIKTVICGHVHRTTHVRWAGTMASIGPSPTVQTDPVFSDITTGGLREQLVLEPGGWQGLWWDGEELLNFGLMTDRSYKRP